MLDGVHVFDGAVAAIHMTAVGLYCLEHVMCIQADNAVFYGFFIHIWWYTNKQYFSEV
jgi:hypothetical protein